MLDRYHCNWCGNEFISPDDIKSQCPDCGESYEIHKMPITVSGLEKEKSAWYALLITAKSRDNIMAVCMTFVQAVSLDEAIGKGYKFAREKYKDYAEINVDGLLCPGQA